MSRLSFSLALLLTAGCGPRSGETTSSGEAAEAPAASSKSLGDQVPSDSTSQGFARKLVGLAIQNHKAVDGDGVTLVYSTLSFEGDGSWNANGAVEVMDETMECTESGSWTMSEATSATVASVEWTVSETNCAGREPEAAQRAEVTLSKSDWELKFR